MGKKLKKFPFLFRPSDATTTAAWPWPAACVTSLRTLSFRADSNASLYTSTINTACDAAPAHSGDPPSSSETPAIGGLAGLTSDDRLFFMEPGETNSILEEAKSQLQGGVAVLALDSRDPFLDFRVSMEEMVEAHGLRDWHRLEELLTCYLTVNGKSNHGYIVGAFVDLLLNLQAVASAIDGGGSASTNSPSSASHTQDSAASQISFSSCTRSSNGQNCLMDDDNGEEIKIADTPPSCCSSSSSSGP